MERNYTRQEVLDIIECEAIESGISRDDFLRFASIETGGNFNELAHNRYSDAKGLFQFVPSTANQYGIGGREFNPVANTDAAARLYLDNRRDLVNRHARNNLPYLSDAAEPNGVDMYVAHQQGVGGYRSIQNALATGEFNLRSTRRNILSNVNADELESLTGNLYVDFRKMPDRELATTFNQYWHAKFDRTRIPEKDIEPITRDRQQQAPISPLADHVLHIGERGSEVANLQRMLNELGYRDARHESLETHSSIYGRRTAESVRSFQQTNELQATGVADHETLLAIRRQHDLPTESRTHSISTQQTQQEGVWPAPGNLDINHADRQGEGRGEFGTPRARGRTHRGIDILGDVGDPVMAYGAGTVRVQPNNGAAGNTVTIDHGNGVVTRYFHLHEINIQNGQQVIAGQQVGTIGRSGNTPRQGDTHLHFEMHQNGRAVDPIGYLTIHGRQQSHLNIAPTTLLQPDSTGPHIGTAAALNANSLRNFEQTLSSIVSDNIEKSPRRMINGMPDYLLSGRNTPDHVASAPHVPNHASSANRSEPALTASGAAVPIPAVAQLQFGDRGPAVLALQENLRLLGAHDAEGRKLKAESDYGESTQKAVEQFQLWTGHPTTGIADKATLDALRSHAQFAAKQQALGIAAGLHLPDNLRPAPFDADYAADLRMPEMIRQVLSFSDSRHPHYELYADVSQRLESKGQRVGLSDERMNEIVGALYRKGYEAGFSGDVVVHHNQFFAREVDLARLGSHVKVDFNQPAPSVQETMQQAAMYDQQQVEYQRARGMQEQMNQGSHASRL